MTNYSTDKHDNEHSNVKLWIFYSCQPNLFLLDLCIDYGKGKDHEDNGRARSRSPRSPVGDNNHEARATDEREIDNAGAKDSAVNGDARADDNNPERDQKSSPKTKEGGD